MARLDATIRIELAHLQAEDPMPLPGEFATALAHAIGHITLRHGVITPREGGVNLIYMGGWGGVHPGPRRPTAMPTGFRKDQPRYEQEAIKFATDLVSAKGLNQGERISSVPQGQS